MNLKETINKYPQSKDLINMRLKDFYYDPFIKDPYKPSRIIAPDCAMV